MRSTTFRRRALALTAVAATAAPITAATTAEAAPHPTTFSVQARADLPLQPDLKIKPSYDETHTLTFSTLEWSDALPEYTVRLTETDSGRVVPLDQGWADSVGDSDLEGPYEVDTAEPLTTGTRYEASLRVVTVGFWHCSIYDSNGCSWYKGERSTYWYRFTYTGGTVKADEFLPPKATTKITLSPRTKHGKRGWKVTATLLKDDKAYAKQPVTGQWRTKGRWHDDSTWRTDADGDLAIRFRGEKTATWYRFVFEGNSTAKRAVSAQIAIKARNGKVARPTASPDSARAVPLDR